MAKIVNLSWDCEIRLTREQIIALSELKQFEANIKTMIMKNFPNTGPSIDFEAVYAALHEINRMAIADKRAHEELSKMAKDINSKD